MATLCLIPARGGSKRVPSKNLREVGGVPLVVRAIRCAAAAGLTPTVSTDCMRIAAVSSAAGAEVIMRPAALATDTAQLEPTVMHAVRSTMPRPERVVLLQPTSPLRRPEHITEALALLDAGYDSVVGVVRDPHLAFAGVCVAEEHGTLWVPNSRERPRTQDVMNGPEPPAYDCGYLYAFTVASFQLHGRRDAGRMAAMIVPSDVAVDVDSERDIALAEAMIASRRDGGNAHRASVLAREERYRNVKLVLLDFDGVMTDGSVYVSQDGTESVRCSRRDGHGVELLRSNGFIVEIVSREANPVVTARARKLRIEVAQSVMDKADAVRQRIAVHQVAPAEALFAGDDVFDIPAMRECGACAAPSDAHPTVLHYVTEQLGFVGPHGGAGFVRALAETLLSAAVVVR